MDCPPIPQFCLDFLLRSKTYLKERPPSASIANRFSTVYQAWGCGEVFTNTTPITSIKVTRCKLCCCTVVYTSTRCEYRPTPLFEPKVRCSAHGPFFTRLRYFFFCVIPEWEFDRDWSIWAGNVRPKRPSIHEVLIYLSTSLLNTLTRSWWLVLARPQQSTVVL